MTVDTTIETDRVCDVAILQEAWRGRCAEPERYLSVVCQVFRDVTVQIAAFEDAQTPQCTRLLPACGRLGVKQKQQRDPGGPRHEKGGSSENRSSKFRVHCKKNISIY